MSPGARRAAGAVVWATAVACAGWALVRTFGLERGFPLVAIIAWTPFLAPVAAATALVAALLRRWGPAALAALATGLLVAAVAPRALGGGHEPATAVTGPELRVLSANTRVGRADPERLVALVRERRADVLCLQELTPGLAAELETAGIGELLPHAVRAGDDPARGVAIRARHRLARRPAPAGIPAVAARLVAPGAAPLEVVCAHPLPPSSPGAVGPWQDALAALAATGGGATPAVVLGDLNATLDHAALRDVLAAGYVDAADATGRGLAPTWPQGSPRPALTLDHVLADERLAIRAYDVHDLPGSDHRAVSATLGLPAAG